MADLPSDDEVVVPVLYGTEFGFCREIADKLAAQLRELDGYWCAACCWWCSCHER